MSKKVEVRKAIGNFDSTYILSLLRLMETQSKGTLIKWSVGYTIEHILPIYENIYPNDSRPRDALINALGWLDGKVKYADARKSIAQVNALTKNEENPVAQAALRAIGEVALSIHVAGHSLGLAFYGTLAIAYVRVGTNESQETYEQIAMEECSKMRQALLDLSVTNEDNPAMIDLRLWPKWRIKGN